MITKKSMIDVLSSIGIEAKGMTKDELTDLCELHGFIQDGLLIKEKPEPETAPQTAPKTTEPETAPKTVPETTPEGPEAEPEPDPGKVPEPKTVPETAPEAPPEAPEKPDELKDLFKKIEQAEGKTEVTGGTKPPLVTIEKRKRKKSESSPDEFRIEGYILLMIIDTVFPFSIAWLNNMFDKRVKVEPTALMLNEKQRSEIEPLADQAADFLAIHINPVAGFLLVSSFLYGNNLIQARIQIENTLPPRIMKVKK